MIGREIGMRASRMEAILRAGMLHDVGKFAVPTTVLRKDGPLTEEEFAAIELHPMRGLEIVQEIGFGDEALAGDHARDSPCRTARIAVRWRCRRAGRCSACAGP